MKRRYIHGPILQSANVSKQIINQLLNIINCLEPDMNILMEVRPIFFCIIFAFAKCCILA